jgi:type I restriction enzyme S subunit
MDVSNWRECQLGDLFVPVNDKSKQVQSTEYRFVGAHPVVDQSARFICGFHDNHEKVIQDNLPITVFGDHTRNTKFVDFPFVPGADGTQLLKPKPKVDDKFLYYLISFGAEMIGNYGYDRHFKHLKEYRCNYPQEELEQTKIAEILSTVDRAIEQTEALIAKQQRITAGLMQDLLTRGIDEQGNLRSEEPHEFKDSPLGRIPVEWDVRSCVQLCNEIVVGIVIRPAQYYRPDGVPVLRSANVLPNRISKNDLVFMGNSDNEMLRKSQLRTGDLVTVRTGYPGTTAVVPPELDGSNCVDIVISRPVTDFIRCGFLSIWINSDHGKRQVLEGQGGLAQQHFNVGEMRRLLVKVPSTSEQARIENVLDAHEIALCQTQDNADKLDSLKKSGSPGSPGTVVSCRSTT